MMCSTTTEDWLLNYDGALGMKGDCTTHTKYFKLPFMRTANKGGGWWSSS